MDEELLKCGSLFSKKIPKILKNSDTYCYFNISSLSEDAFMKLSQENKSGLVKWHKEHLTRVYPSGIRIGSSNYNAIEKERAGA